MAQDEQSGKVAGLSKNLLDTLGGVWHRIRPLLPGKSVKALPAPQTSTDPADDTTQRLRAMQHDFQEATVRLGIIGEAGSGKSSLINAIVGRDVARVGTLIETTQGPQEVPVDGLTLVALPRCAPPNWPRDTYLQRFLAQRATTASSWSPPAGSRNACPLFDELSAGKSRSCRPLAFRPWRPPSTAMRSHEL